MLIKSDSSTITMSIGVARALVAFAGEDVSQSQLAIGVDPAGVLGATDGHSAIRFPLVTIGTGMTGACWTRAHVAQELKVAKARQADAIVLHREQAMPGVTFPPLHQVVPERGVGADVCMAGHLIARVELAVDAVHDGPRGRGRAPHGAYLVSARERTAPLMWWVATPSGDEVAAQVLVMPINAPLTGALASADGYEGLDERRAYAA